MPITIDTTQRRLPLIKLDSNVYFVMSDTYQRLDSEKVIDEKYTLSLNIDRQVQNTGCHRWKMTLLVPLSTSNITYTSEYTGYSFGNLDTLHTTADKVYPYDLIEYWDITKLEDFSGTYSHQVYVRLDWESPFNNDPKTYQIPLELWGYSP